MSDIFNHEADAWDSLIYHDYEGIGYGPRYKTCKTCGTNNLWFVHTGNVWHLEEHNCFNKVMERMRNASRN